MKLITIPLIFFLVGSYYIESYELTYTIFSILLFTAIFSFESLNVKILAFFFLIYFVIPFPNISTFRGTIEFLTIKLYSLFILFALVPFMFRLFRKKSYRTVLVRRISGGNRFFVLAILHLTIAYIFLAYIFLTHGFIFLNQDSRLGLNTYHTYILKSTIYIPLFYPFLDKTKRKKILFFFILFVLPIIPSLLIGSRGSVLLVLISVSIILILKTENLNDLLTNKFARIKSKHRLRIATLGMVGLVAVYVVFYIRRSGEGSLITATELLEYYFEEYNVLHIIILPMYTSLRETVGITNRILVNDYQNLFLSYPLFFAELITILPGVQPAPGQILAKEIIGAKSSGGLTPGILGGMYLDFGYYLLILPIGLSLFIKWLFKKAFYSDFFKIIYALTLAQYLHVYHRGFLKLEYLVAYFIIIIYYLFQKKTTCPLS